MSTITVDPTSGPAAIETALQAAVDGDTLLLGPGTFVEPELDIQVSVTFRPARPGTVIWRPSGASLGTVGAGVVAFEDIAFDGRGAAGFAISADVDIERCSFDGFSGADGGALSLTGGALALTDTVFDGNDADRGGAVFASGASSLSVTRGAFTNNLSRAEGGAAYLDTVADLRWANVRVEDNAASRGGAIYALDSVGSVLNAAFARNDATSGGDAIELGSGADIALVGDLFVDQPDTALVAALWSTDPQYCAFFRNGTDANTTLDNTNVTANPGARADFGLYDRSRMRDAGDPAALDLDGTVADIGLYGGPDADPAAFVDADADASPWVYDCEDDEAAVFPGTTETCDDRDQDCDGLDDQADTVTGSFILYNDSDADGYGSGSGFPTAFCLGSNNSRDCDDFDRNVHPGAVDAPADGVDTDCDGFESCWLDADGDGVGTDTLIDGGLACGGPSQSNDPDDCDDSDRNVFPGAVEVCGDGLDQDCVGPDWAGVYADDDGDSVPFADDVDDCDPDDDDDGVATAVEIAAWAAHPLGDNNLGWFNPDTDEDGVGDDLEWGATLDTVDPQDHDADGIVDPFDIDDDGDGIDTRTEGTGDDDGTERCVPTGDGIPNYLDLNSDVIDGVVPHVGCGMFVDAPDAVEGEGDNDADGIPNYRDCADNDGGCADGDGDGVYSRDEAQVCYDATPQDCVGEYWYDIAACCMNQFDADSDGDCSLVQNGFCNDDGPEMVRDTDGDGLLDVFETDDDDDGIPSATERDETVDTDADGLPDRRDADDNGDGIPTADQLTADGDCDGIFDYIEVGDALQDGPCGEHDTDVPDTDPPDTDVPDTDAPDTDAPDTDVPDTDVPDTDVHESKCTCASVDRGPAGVLGIALAVLLARRRRV